MSFCSRDYLLPACVPPVLGWRAMGGRDGMAELPGAPESGDRRDREILAPQPFQDYTEAGSEEMHRDNGGLQLRVQKKTRLNLRGPYATKGAS